MENNRQRVSIPISGLNTSTDDQMVSDGAMATVDNLRFSGGSWRDTKPFRVKRTTKRGSSSTMIAYKHPADEEDVYITKSWLSGTAIRLARARVGASITTLQTIADVHTDAKIMHFGKILIVADSATKKMLYYRLAEGIYEAFDYPSPPETYRLPYCITNDSPFDNGEREGYSYAKSLTSYDGTESIQTWKLVDKDGAMLQPTFLEDYWWGELALIVAYELEDGQEIAPSAMDIIASEFDQCGAHARKLPFFGDSHMKDYWGDQTTISRQRLLKDYKDESLPICITNIDAPDRLFPDDPQDQAYWPFGTNSFRILPKIRIKIDQAATTSPLIKNVCIYTTRVNPIWDAKKLSAQSNFRNGAEFRFSDYYADNRLPDQPFYKVDSIPVQSFINGEMVYELSASKLDGIEHKTTYEAVDTHRHFFGDSKEYNSRLHAAPHTTLFAGFGQGLFSTDSGTDDTQYVGAIIPVSGANYRTVSPCYDRFSADRDLLKKILSYPDYRAKYISQVERIGNAYHEYGRYELKAAQANNYAYKITPDVGETVAWEDYSGQPQTYYAQYVKYSTNHLPATNMRGQEFAPEAEVADNNTLRVSGAYNPLVWPLANAYAIGSWSNRVLAINSGAIELSDSKFGEFPLYVFSEEGVFALQSGSGEVLYSAIIPINYDKIINPQTLSVNGNVLYITSRGLQSIVSKETMLLSEAINGSDNLPPMEFLSTAQMFYQPRYGEVVLFSNALNAYEDEYLHEYAYIYSIGGQLWSRRIWTEYNDPRMGFAPYLLNNGEVVQNDELSVYILNPDDEVRTGTKTTEVKLVSRPIKLGSMEFKRLETIIPRLKASKETLVQVDLEGTADLQSWYPLGRALEFIKEKSMILRRTPMSVRYLRITLTAHVGGDITINGFDVEYYLRFIHRMR